MSSLSMGMPEGLDVLFSRLLARSIAASRPASSLQVSTRVVVTVHLDRLHRRISVTGRSPFQWRGPKHDGHGPITLIMRECTIPW